MAVQHCEEVTGRDGSRDKRNHKRYTRIFQLVTDSATDGAATVRDHPALPAIGDPFDLTPFGGTDVDAEVFLVEKRPSQGDADNLQNWTVHCEYVGRGDPTTEPAEISWSCVKYQAATQVDIISGDPVVNSAGDPFEGGLTVDRTRFVVMIRKNVLTYNPLDWVGFIDTTNDLVFLSISHPPGFPIGTCKLSDVSADAVWLEDDSAIHFWRQQVKVEVDLRGWQPQVLDAGFNRKLPAAVLGFDRAPIILPYGGKLSSPHPLDGVGQPLAAGAVPVFRTFATFTPADWTLLNLEY